MKLGLFTDMAAFVFAVCQDYTVRFTGVGRVA
jgi:hypothetical protein